MFLFSGQPQIIITIVCLVFFSGCKTVPVRREIREVQEITGIASNTRYIKAHMKNGTVFILHHWHFDSLTNLLHGYGSLLDINRKLVAARGNMDAKKTPTGEMFKVPIPQISLIETNDPGPSIAGGLALVTGVTAGFGVYCLINPKACFGSCPTFYASNGDSLLLQAEGFSTSIAPSLERSDIDMLYTARPANEFELVVTNEALETHSIRHANLLAIEKTGNERVFVTPNGIFYRCTSITPPTQCQSPGEECLKMVRHADSHEYYSLADSTNLNSREELIVTFSVDTNKELGLVIGKRQTLLTTYLMYQGLAYMGNSAAYWLAEMERGRPKPEKSVFSLLGGVQIFSKLNEDEWTFEGEVNETGPIATDFNIIPLSHQQPGKVTLKLRLNKGLWRIDYLGLAILSEKVVPLVIKPSGVDILQGSERDPLSKLTNDDAYLVTYPGDSYKIKYNLPFNEAELFLDSKGYYLEWIRDEWIKEQNFRKMALMIKNPSMYLRRASAEYKKIEPAMEKTFWSSRYVKR